MKQKLGTMAEQVAVSRFQQEQVSNVPGYSSI
jgi:hypothetical protein